MPVTDSIAFMLLQGLLRHLKRLCGSCKSTRPSPAFGNVHPPIIRSPTYPHFAGRHRRVGGGGRAAVAALPRRVEPRLSRGACGTTGAHGGGAFLGCLPLHCVIRRAPRILSGTDALPAARCAPRCAAPTKSASMRSRRACGMCLGGDAMWNVSG